MGPAQIFAVALCIVINMMDGFDILAAGFTAPAISRAWTLRPTELGLLFSSGLAGMVIGALALSPLADRLGRRRIVLIGLAIVTLGMLTSAVAPGLWVLVMSRIVTGAGVAATMATLNTVVAEYANDRRRDLAVVLQAAGFPLGGLLGGLGVYLIADQSWRWVFAAGAGFSVLLMAGVLAWLPESLDFLLERRPPDTLARVNRLLVRLRLPEVEALVQAPMAGRIAMRALLRGELARGSLLLCAAFFTLMFTFYFLTSWTPKLLTDYGLSTRGGVSGAVFMNMGGVAGDVAFGLLTLRWTAARLGPSFMVACAGTTVAFAFIPTSLAMLMPTAFLLGFLLFGSMACLFAMAPAIFPALTRTTGTGLALGIGRIGAVIGPYAGGLLIAAKWNRAAYLMAMAAPLLLCAAATYAISMHMKPEDGRRRVATPRRP